MLVAADDYRELQAVEWSALPASWRLDGRVTEWADANVGAPVGSFLEGPDFAPDGSLWCVDIPHGRIFSVSPQGEWRLACRYDAWPNGLKVQGDGSLIVADHRHGLIEIDPRTGRRRELLARRHSQGFIGLNDLHLAADGAVWFSDQGQSGLHDPSGRVYRWSRSGAPDCVLDRLPSPNGLRLSADGRTLWVAVTRDNAVWRAPLVGAAAQPSKVGRFASFYGPVGPDGLHLDAAGRLWVCLPGADTVWVLDMRGELRLRVRFPAGALPTNVALDERRGRACFTCSGLQAIWCVDFGAA